MIWYAIECRMSKTLDVMADLKSQGFEAFTPIETVRKRISGKKWGPVPVAAFPGYVFLGSTKPVHVLRILDTDHVTDFLRAAGSDNAARIPDKVIRRVINMSADDLNDHIRKIREGGKAEVIGGPYAGLMLLITKIKGSRAKAEPVTPTLVKEIDISLDDLEAA